VPTKKTPEVRVVPANEASWDDLNSIVGAARCYDLPCFCQRFKSPMAEWRVLPAEERAHRLRTQTDCGNPDATATTGLVAYCDDDPAAWCAVEPRTAYPKLRGYRIPWSGRDEDKSDASVWAVTCMLVRVQHRHTHMTYELARAAVEYARERGASALEAYPMLTEPGQVITWGELHVGPRNAFAAAGFKELTRPSKRRVVMRVDFER
jgi:hypothetical protein